VEGPGKVFPASSGAARAAAVIAGHAQYGFGIQKQPARQPES